VSTTDSSGGWLGHAPIILALSPGSGPGAAIKAIFRYNRSGMDPTRPGSSAGATLASGRHPQSSPASPSLESMGWPGCCSVRSGPCVPKFDQAVTGAICGSFTQPLFTLVFPGLIGNIGLAILARTVIVKAVFLPAANKSYESLTR